MSAEDMSGPCCMCGELIYIGETFQLTDEEMDAIGPTATRHIHYCSGCLKAARNLRQGASILSAVFERKLRAAGVPAAEEVAARFKAKLIEAATRKLQ